MLQGTGGTVSQNTPVAVFSTWPSAKASGKTPFRESKIATVLKESKHVLSHDIN